MRYLRRALALLTWMAPLTGCLNVSPPGTAFASDPPGARVQIDGHDSGWVTPCLIALDEEETHRVTISLTGFAAREIMLVPNAHRSFVSWHHGLNGFKSVVRLPILLPTVDLLFPVRDVEALEPGRVFVHLRPESAP